MNRMIAAVAALTLLSAVVAVAQQNGFPDVPDDHPRKAAIDYAVERGWFRGYEDGRFGPDDKITETQAAKVILRVFPGLTRAEAAAVIKAGNDALKPATSSDASGTTTTTAATDADDADVPEYEYPNKPVFRLRNFSWTYLCQDTDARAGHLARVEDPERKQVALRKIEADCVRQSLQWDVELVYSPPDTGPLNFYYLADEMGRAFRIEGNSPNVNEFGKHHAPGSYDIGLFTEQPEFEFVLDAEGREVPVFLICERWAAFVEDGTEPAPPEQC